MAAVEATKITEKEIMAGETPRYTDLREWLEIVESFGQLKKVDGGGLEPGDGNPVGAHRPGEQGSRTCGSLRQHQGLPRGIPGVVRPERLVQAHGAGAGPAIDLTDLDLVRATREKISQHNPIPHRVVETGLVMENVLMDSDINLLKFPVPFIHEMDGGRYIGTGCLVVTRTRTRAGSISAPTAAWSRTRRA